MPEIKNIFTSGRMNKDLDERIISKNEYRDALNVDIVTSEGSNVGSLQNIRGNKKVAEFKNDDGGVAIAGQQCIGSVRNTRTDKIYWFIAGTAIDAIVEYDPVINNHVPVLISVHNRDSGGTAAQDVLKFNTNYLITGVNIIDDLMFFTDDKNEPKCINIEQCKKGCASSNPYSTRTNFHVDNVSQGVMKEEYITTIKKYPLNAPTLTMARTKDANRTGVSTCTMKDSAGDFVSGTDQRPSGYVTGFLKFQPAPHFKTGDIVKLTAPTDDVNSDDELVVRIKLTGAPDKHSGGTYVRFKAIILSMSSELANTGIVWTAALEKEDPIFELQFPRFAYRWKYSDGEYSAFSPFSEVAFLPDHDVEGNIFDAKDGYNLTMTNQLRSLILSNFDERPKGCIEVDILIKQVNDTNVYTIKTLTNKGAKEELDTVESGGSGFEVVSEQVHAVLPSNQLLRPYDNVPRKAKAQEVTANRVVYGNYLQNFDLEGAQPIFEPYITPNKFDDADINKAKPSLKSIRTYQVGVVLLDEYGRQTPVLTDDSAIVKISQADSDKQNTLKCNIKGVNQSTFNAPSWATHFKYFIKENSNEYYNLPLDRFYKSEDGNMWLSFVSSDRNKVDEETYLILKKSHTENIATKHDDEEKTLKYKIISISDTVPTFLVKRKVSLGKIKTVFGVSTTANQGDRTGFPQESFLSFNVPGIEISGDHSPFKDLATDGVGDKYVQISTGTSVSDTYKIQSIEPVNAVKTETTIDYSTGYPSVQTTTDDPDDTDTKDEGDFWTITLTKAFGDDINFVGEKGESEVSNLSLELFKEEDEDNKPEFDGKFFVKVNRDKYLEEYLVANKVEKKWITLYEQNISYITLGGSAVGAAAQRTALSGRQDYFKGSSDEAGEGWSIDKGAFIFNHPAGIAGKPADMHAIGKGISGKTLELRFTALGKPKDPLTKDPSPGDFSNQSKYGFHEALKKDGTYLKFEHDDSVPEDDRYYKIEGTPVLTPGYNWLTGAGKLKQKVIDSPSAKGIRYTITLDKPLKWNPLTSTTTSTPLVAVPESVGINDHRLTSKSKTSLQVVQEIEETESFHSSSPAVFETEPKEKIDLDIYYETHQTFPIAQIGDDKTLKWHNCFAFGNGLESNRIRDDFNQVFVDKGAKASTVFAEQYQEERRETGMIYSGIFNSTSGINRLNQFIQAEKITKDVNPSYGSIQKLHARDSDLVVLCEDKCLKVLANKDALFNADGNTNVTATSNVLGQSIPFVGDYGISKNPESFACYAFRSYWADKARGAVIRLSRDGITNISDKGMRDYFADNLKGDKYEVLPGGYDEDKDIYNLTLKKTNNSTTGETISYSEFANGWTSRKSFIPQSSLSINGTYYSMYVGDLWRHNDSSIDYSKFYDAPNGYASVKFIFNDQPSSIKNFKTLNYEGTDPQQTKYEGTIGDPGVSYTGLTIDEVIAKKPTLAQSDALNPSVTKGWYCDSITTSEQTGEVKEFKDKEGKWFSSIRNKSITATDLQTGDAAKEFAIQGIGNASSNSTDSQNVSGGTITLSLNKATGGATYEVSTLAPFIRENGSVNESFTFVISPSDGKVVTAADFDCSTSGGQTSSPVNDCFDEDAVTFANQSEADSCGNFGTDNTVLVTVPLNFTHGDAAQSIVANITGNEHKRKYTVKGTYTTNVENATPSSQSGVEYTATGEVGEEVTIDLETGDASVVTKTFTATTGNNFKDLPPLVQVSTTVKGFRRLANNYTFTTSDTGTPGNVNHTARAFTAKVKIPNENAEEDIMLFYAKGEPTVTASSNQLYDFNLDQTSIHQNGETRTLTVSGDTDSQVIVDVKNASNSSIISGPVTLTMVNGQATQDIIFPLSSSSTTYTVTITETGANRFDMSGSFSGASGSAGSRVKTLTLNQRADVTVTFSATTSSSDLTIDGNATTSNITSTGKAETEEYEEVTLTYVVESGNNGSITANSATTTYSFDHTKWTGTLSGLEKTLSNGSVVSFSALQASMNDNTATITGKATVVKYGTANDTTTLDVDNFLSVVATAPSATLQSVTVGFNTATTITMAGTDPQGGTNLTFAIHTQPNNGTLSSITEGSGLTSTVVYTPNSTFSGADSFKFTVSDGTTTSSPARVLITVNGQSHQWSVDNRGGADANAVCNQPWGTGGQIDTVYAASSHAFAPGLRFYTDATLTTPYNPATNGTSSAPDDSHRFTLGAAGGNCGYHGIIGSIGHVSIVYDCCGT